MQESVQKLQMIPLFAAYQFGKLVDCLRKQKNGSIKLPKFHQFSARDHPDSGMAAAYIVCLFDSYASFFRPEF